jgi:MYXO-CTERM domain-containing protein
MRWLRRPDSGVLTRCYPSDGLDVDGDGIANEADNCAFVANAEQADADGDGLGDDCDSLDNSPDQDVDGDGIANDADNCPFAANVGQEDTDEDGLGDVCDEFENKVDSGGCGCSTGSQMSSGSLAGLFLMFLLGWVALRPRRRNRER